MIFCFITWATKRKGDTILVAVVVAGAPQATDVNLSHFMSLSIYSISSVHLYFIVTPNLEWITMELV